MRAIQYYTIVNSGIDLKDISIVYINNQYTKDGDIDIEQLFAIESVYDQVLGVSPPEYQMKLEDLRMSLKVLKCPI